MLSGWQEVAIFVRETIKLFSRSYLTFSHFFSWLAFRDRAHTTRTYQELYCYAVNSPHTWISVWRLEIVTKSWTIFWGEGWLCNFLRHDFLFRTLRLCIIFSCATTCARICFKSKTQDLDNRKNVLDFYFPYGSTCTMFFRQFLLCGNHISGGKCPIPPPPSPQIMVPEDSWTFAMITA